MSSSSSSSSSESSDEEILSMPDSIQFLNDNLGGIPTSEIKDILEPYARISECLKVPKADAEMSVHMDWMSKDVSKIETREQAQSLYETEKHHPGLAADVHNRMQYQDILHILTPILSLKEEIQDHVDPVKTISCLNASLKMGANALHNITSERRDRMWRKDPLNRDLRDFHKNPDNYSLEDAPHFVFGPEFCGSRLNAFAAITDEERMRQIVAQAWRRKKAAKSGNRKYLRDKKRRPLPRRNHNRFDLGFTYDRRANSSNNYRTMANHGGQSTRNFDRNFDRNSSNRDDDRQVPNTQISEMLHNLGLENIDIPLFYEMKHKNVDYVGGRIQNFLPNWEKITKNQEILNIVNGHEIILINNCNNNIEDIETPFSKKLELVIEKAIQTQLIEKTEVKGTCSPVFLKNKPDGSCRMILDLSRVNTIIEYIHFKMSTFNDAKNMIDKDDFMIKLDLRSAYDCVLISEKSRSLLQFIVNGQRYNYRGFPNGLCEAPRLFTKLTKPIVEILHRIGAKMIIYIDDLLLAARDKNLLLKQAAITVKLLMLLGFIINVNKSCLIPSKVITFLGYQINSKSMTFQLTEEKQKEILQRCIKLNTKQNPIPAKQVASVTGSIQFAINVIKIGNLHFRNLQKQVSDATLTGNWNQEILLNQSAKEDLEWWITTLKRRHYNNLRNPPITIVITSDASKQGWGGTYRNLITKKKLKTNGIWTKQESLHHINLLELKAAFFTMQALASNVRSTSLKVRMDNSTAVAVLKKMGSSKSMDLNKQTAEIYTWAESRKITIIPNHLPGKLNTEADKLSREIMPDWADWMLDPEIFKLLEKKLGPLTLDLFASRWNAQVKKFYTWKAQPSALGTNALSHKWPNVGAYAFPPVALIPVVLNKILQENLKQIIVITPAWPTQNWYSKLLNMSIKEPIILPQTQNLLVDAQNQPPHLLNYKTFRLVAWTLCGTTSEHLDSLRKQPDSWQILTETPRSDLTTRPGIDGAAGVTPQGLIRFRQL